MKPDTDAIRRKAAEVDISKGYPHLDDAIADLLLACDHIDALTEENKRMREALDKISYQHLTHEMDTDAHPDYERGYNCIIMDARNAIKPKEGE